MKFEKETDNEQRARLSDAPLALAEHGYDGGRAGLASPARLEFRYPREGGGRGPVLAADK